MKLKKIVAFALILCMVLSLSTVLAGSKWVDVNGQNLKARLYKGWVSQHSWFVMKWSKDWDPMQDEPVGAWVTNHYTWYSNDYNESTWYGWETMTAYEEGAYRIEELMKIMSVGDDKAAWAKYQAAGAYSANWGQYDDGVPRYIVLSDNLTVYKGTSNKVVMSLQFVKGVPQGLGQPSF